MHRREGHSRPASLGPFGESVRLPEAAGPPSAKATVRPGKRAQAFLNSAVGCVFVVGGLLCNEFFVRHALGVGRIGWIARASLYLVSVGMIAWSIVSIRCRGHDKVTSINLVVCSTVLAVVGVEFGLRQWPMVLGNEYATGVLSKYSEQPGGIYYWDPAARLPFMWPNHRTRMYYNGYRWEHQTDALGFRNRTERIPADLVLLGDSFIYGHGVDLEGTVGHFLEQCSGATVMNLAQQGQGAYWEAYVLTEHIEALHPRIVIHFFFENDILDAYNYRQLGDVTAITAFAETPVEAIRFPPRTRLEAARRWNESRWQAEREERRLLDWLRQSTHLGRVWDWLAFRRDMTELMQRIRAYDIDNEASPGWHFTKNAILYMSWLSRQHGARFVMAPITSSNVRHRDILHRFAKEHGVELVDTDRLQVARDPTLFLEEVDPRHFSPKGAKLMAQMVCGYLGLMGRE